jgi:uncharacterized damage-inducible protein DinB
MKELLQQYAAYNSWANKMLFERINKLSDEDINKEIASSFPSLYKTVQHMWRAADIWYQRLKLVENIVSSADGFTGSFAELCSNLAKQDQQWKEWIDGATETQINHVFAYIRNKEQEKLPVYQMLVHLFNHATYHRGQLVTLLRQLNAEKIPATDFSAYCRLKNKVPL